MRISVVGQGSIGKRHSENLSDLGHKVVPIDLGDKLPFDVDCSFICSPTALHTEHAYEYLSRGIPTFIEKPLCYNLEQLSQLVEQLKNNDTPSMVGCNLRFHPAIRDAKDIVEKHKVIFARAEYGYYLPFWRKGDYRKSYSAGIDGGIILDDIHELDYLYWLFGNFIDLKMVYAKVSDLEIMQEDVAEISILFQNGTTGSIHQDYLCKNYHRTLELHLGHETVKFEINPTNLAFKKEIEYFCRCVEQKIKPMNNVGEAAYVLRRIFEAKNPRCNPSTTDINQTTTEGSSGFRRKTYSGKSDRKVSTSGTSVESSSSVASSHTD